MALNSISIDSFRDNGFLVCQGLLPEEVTYAFENLFFSGASEKILADAQNRRFYGPFPTEDEYDSLDGSLIRRGFRWIDRRYSTNVWSYQSFLGSGPVLDIASALLECSRDQLIGQLRGMYGTLPCCTASGEHMDLCPHTDPHSFALGAVAYLHDVPKGGGGLCVWPSSHKEMSHAYSRVHGGDRMFDYHLILNECLAKIDLLEINGTRGDVIFWSNRLIHAPGSNHSNRLRIALLGDFFLKE